MYQELFVIAIKFLSNILMLKICLYSTSIFVAFRLVGCIILAFTTVGATF